MILRTNTVKVAMKIGIIGGGPAGYVAAIRAAQLGGTVTLFERANLGGTCTNWGCIPTKALFSAAHKIENFYFGKAKKIWDGVIDPNWQGIQDHKNAVVAKLVRGIEFLLKKNKVSFVRGEAEFLSDHEISVNTVDGAKTFIFDKIIIATGTKAAVPPIPGLSEIDFWDNIGVLSTTNLPKDMVILGGGVIGVEFAHIFRTFGVDVTIIEMLPKILATIDDEISTVISKALINEGVKIKTATRAVGISRASSGICVEAGNGEKFFAEKLLVATGRRALLPNGADNAGITLSHNMIPVDSGRKTKVESIFAAGDITGEPLLAHKASHEGIIAAENAFGLSSSFDATNIPGAIFTAMEIGTCGLTESAAREKFGEVKIGKFPYLACGRALADGDTSGFVKTIAAPDGHIIGFHAVGTGASELLGLGGFFVQQKISANDVAHYIFAHPTLTEMVSESALATAGLAINI